jgi:hypothetical protein
MTLTPTLSLRERECFPSSGASPKERRFPEQRRFPKERRFLKERRFSKERRFPRSGAFQTAVASSAAWRPPLLGWSSRSESARHARRFFRSLTAVRDLFSHWEKVRMRAPTNDLTRDFSVDGMHNAMGSSHREPRVSSINSARRLPPPPRLSCYQHRGQWRCRSRDLTCAQLPIPNHSGAGWCYR